MYGERIGQLGAEKRPGWLAGRRKVAKSSMRHARGVAGLAVVAPPASQLSLPPPFPPLSCFPPHDTPVTRDTLRICVPSLPPLPCSPPSRPRSLRPRVRILSSAPPSDVPLVALVEPRTAPLRPALDTGTATPSQGVSGHWGSLEFLLHGARTAPCGSFNKVRRSNRIASACSRSPLYTSLYSVGGLRCCTYEVTAVAASLRRPMRRNEAARLINAKNRRLLPKTLATDSKYKLAALPPPCRPHYQHPDCALPVPGPSSLAEYCRLSYRVDSPAS
jgi:hypothetical protein